MENLINVLKDIKDDVKEIKSCTIVLKMKDEYTIKMITVDDFGDTRLEEL